MDWIWNAVNNPEQHQGLWLMVTAIAGSISVLIVLAAAWFAAGQLTEARQLRSAQLRPFVVIEFRTEPSSLIYLRISNLGSTMARDVRFAFDRPLATTRGEGHNLMELQIFRSGIPTLPPGRVIEFFFDTWIGRAEADDRYQVKVKYRGDGRRRAYEEPLDLDLGLFRNMQFIRQKGLDDIAKELERLRQRVDDFKAFGGGVLALSPEDVRKREDEWERRVEEHRRAGGADHLGAAEHPAEDQP
jgi:hypothetical protein